MPRTTNPTEYLDHHDATHRRIVDRALRDPEFRRELEADPKAALSRELGVELPGEVTVRLVRESEQDIVIVLPEAAKAVESAEIRDLSDEELQTAAEMMGCRISWYYTWEIYEPLAT